MSDNNGSAPAGNPPAGGEGTPPAGTTPPAGSTPPAGNAPPIGWLPEADSDTVGYVQNKKWGGPGDLLKSYKNLETVIGAPPDQIIRLPKDGDEAAWAGVYERLGRPKTADEYDVPVPDANGDAEFAKTFKTWAHEAGLNGKQAKALAEKWNAHVAGQYAKVGEDYQLKLASEESTLKKEWGAAHDQNIQIAKNAAAKFGVAPEKVEALEQVMGYAETIKFFHGIGARMGEAQFVGGDRGNGGGFGSILTPAQAQARIDELRGDKEWTASYLSGDKAKVDQMRKLQEMANAR
jgi:hypothetical protein